LATSPAPKVPDSSSSCGARFSGCGLWRLKAAPPRLRLTQIDRLVWDCMSDADLLSQWLARWATVRSVLGLNSWWITAETTAIGRPPSPMSSPPGSTATGSSPTSQNHGRRRARWSADATDLRLTHSALGDFATSYRDGGCVRLCYPEAAALGTALVRSMFWPLHGTIAKLTMLSSLPLEHREISPPAEIEPPWTGGSAGVFSGSTPSGGIRWRSAPAMTPRSRQHSGRGVGEDRGPLAACPSSVRCCREEMPVDAQELVTSPPCELCGQPISPDRIDALPRATTCIACASLRKRPSRGQTCS